jgi:hypothetical protein
MKIINERVLLLLIINILFKSKKSFYLENFSNWNDKKRSYNKRINNLIIYFLSKNSRFHADEKIRYALLISHILRLLYPLRVNSFYIHKYLSKKYCVWYIYLKILFLLVIRLLKSLASLFLKINFSNEVFKGKNDINILLSFPSHSFSVSNNKNERSFSSFGELHQKKLKNINILSVNEYVRKSKKLESTVPKQNLLSDKKLKRSISKNNFSLIYFFTNLRKLMKLIHKGIWQRKLPCLALLNLAINIRLIPYKNLFDKLNRNKKIKSIYSLMFSEFEFLSFDEKYKKYYSMFSYSDNSLIPLYNLDKSDSVNNKDFIFSSVTGICHTFGMISHTKIVQNFLKKNLNLPNSYFPTSDYIPCVLGYESRFLNNQNYKPSILIFDVPEETIDSQLSRSVYGDLVVEKFFLNNFFGDFLSVVKNYDIKIFYKPKYSIENLQNKDHFYSIIDKFSKTIGDNFYIINPYDRLEDTMNRSNLVINIPYTSTYSFALSLGLNSYYFIPTKYAAYFKKFNSPYKQLLGKRALKNAIEDLIDKYEVRT